MSYEKASPVAPNRTLASERDAAYGYIRASVNKLLGVMGTIPLKAEELEDRILIEIDPVGIVSEAFEQVLDHLHQTNEKLRAAHDDLTAVFDSLGAAILVVDNDLQILSHNRMALEMFATEGKMIFGRRCMELICCRETPPADCSLMRAVESGKRTTGREVGVNGRHFDVIATPVFSAEGGIDHIVITYHDVTERIAALNALSASERRYRDLFENAHDLIAAFGEDGRLLYANRMWVSRLGQEEEAPPTLSVFDIVAPERKRAFRDAVTHLKNPGESTRLSTAILGQGGEPVLLEGDLTAYREEGKETLAFRGIFRDVTEERRLAEEIIKAQRLESVGFLAGGIAHDFNNFLTAILGNISLARMYEKQGLTAERKLEEAERAAVRAQRLTKQLLTFAKGGTPVKKEIQLSSLTREAATFATSGTKVRCRFEMDEELWPVKADAGQLDQVVQNLVINAVQAMPDGGTVTIRCTNTTAEEESDKPLAPGNYICLSVADEGVGIAPEIINRVFDPYFSTRAGGTGLGLATVYSVVRDHAGFISVDSKPGEGSCFVVYLPALPGATTAEERTVEKKKGDGEHILVMDDDSAILSLVCEILKHLGYKAEACTDGSEAVHRYEQALRAGKPFDLVIMDLTVPGGMGGKQAIRELKKIDPTVRAVVSSGYSDDAVMSDCTRYGFAAVAAKPYRVETLAKVVRETLGKK